MIFELCCMFKFLFDKMIIVMLKIDNLYVCIGDKEIFKGLLLDVKFGQVYVIMGFNGVGKFILGNVLVGCDGYEVSEGSVQFEGVDLFELVFEEWVVVGLFLVFQYLVEIFGVNNIYFLCVVFNVQCKVCGQEELDFMQFFKLVWQKLVVLYLKDELLYCGVNEGFFGGEKKCNEIFQLVVFELKLVILDEIDFGLDIDVFKSVVDGVNVLCLLDCLFLVIIYYQCLLDYIKLDVVYVLVDGKIVQSGGLELVLELEVYGYYFLKDCVVLEVVV